MAQISYEQFAEVEIRVGKVLKAEGFPNAKKPAYRLEIDFGDHGIKQSSAQITARYSAEELVGRQILAVTNLAPKQIANFLSDVLVLGVVVNQGEVVLIQPDREVPLGKRIL